MKIKDMTNQQIFDAVVEHAAKQYKKAVYSTPTGDKCRYRVDGNKCFVGALIDDEDYTEAMENYRVQHEVFDNLRTPEQQWLLGDLQRSHDDYEPYEWVGRLIYIGGLQKLDTSGVVSKFEEYNRLC